MDKWYEAWQQRKAKTRIRNQTIAKTLIQLSNERLWVLRNLQAVPFESLIVGDSCPIVFDEKTIFANPDGGMIHGWHGVLIDKLLIRKAQPVKGFGGWGSQAKKRLSMFQSRDLQMIYWLQTGLATTAA
jgi:hypothetical protein